jgi:hypothetical protein
MLPLAEALESGAIGLLLSVSCTYLYSRRKGAEALDMERVTEIGGSVALQKEAATELDGQKRQVKFLTDALARKHPHNEKKEADIARGMAAVDDRQRKAIVLLLESDEVQHGRLQAMGFDADWFHRREDFPPILAYRSFRPGNGTVEMDRFYCINSEWKEALRNVLFPADRAPS